MDKNVYKTMRERFIIGGDEAIQKEGDHMKTLEDYKLALEAAGPRLREKLLAQADADGFTAWELAELAEIGAWA